MMDSARPSSERRREQEGDHDATAPTSIVSA